jgi:hypothetical protein
MRRVESDMQTEYVWQQWSRFFRGVDRVRAEARLDSDTRSSLPCGLTFELAQFNPDWDPVTPILAPRSEAELKSRFWAIADLRQI